MLISLSRGLHVLGDGPGKRAYVDGGAAVRKLRKRHAVKLADTTGKQNGHPYLEILPDWFEDCCFRVIYSLYALIS